MAIAVSKSSIPAMCSTTFSLAIVPDIDPKREVGFRFSRRARAVKKRPDATSTFGGMGTEQERKMGTCSGESSLIPRHRGESPMMKIAFVATAALRRGRAAGRHTRPADRAAVCGNNPGAAIR